MTNQFEAALAPMGSGGVNPIKGTVKLEILPPVPSVAEDASKLLTAFTYEPEGFPIGGSFRFDFFKKKNFTLPGNAKEAARTAGKLASGMAIAGKTAFGAAKAAATSGKGEAADKLEKGRAELREMGETVKTGRVFLPMVLRFTVQRYRVTDKNGKVGYTHMFTSLQALLGDNYLNSIGEPITATIACHYAWDGPSRGIHVSWKVFSAGPRFLQSDDQSGEFTVWIPDDPGGPTDVAWSKNSKRRLFQAMEKTRREASERALAQSKRSKSPQDVDDDQEKRPRRAPVPFAQTTTTSTTVTTTTTTVTGTQQTPATSAVSPAPQQHGHLAASTPNLHTHTQAPQVPATSPLPRKKKLPKPPGQGQETDEDD